MKKTALLLAIAALSLSCSKAEKVEKNMDTMKENTEKMSSTTENLKNTTSIMYQQMRAKEAESARNEKFSILNSRKENIGSRITAAAVYFKSFEYQLWTDQKVFDDDHMRDLLFLDAANEFIKRISDIYEKINLKSMSPTKKGRRHYAEMTFYALALTMHMNNNFQDELLRSNSQFKTISFYDIIKKALVKESNGQVLTEYEAVLVSGHNKEIMIELIKARVDIISVLALKNLTETRDMTIKQKLRAGLFKLSNGKLGSIDLPERFFKTNALTNNQTIQFLDEALNTRAFLESIGSHKELEKTLKSAFSNLNLEGTPQKNYNSDKSMINSRAELKSIIERLLL